MAEVIERRVRVGLELIDGLTGGPIVAAVRIHFDGVDLEVLRASASRWFVEDDLPATARVIVDADGYVREAIDVASLRDVRW